MDIVTHILSGAVLGAVPAILLCKRRVTRIGVVALGSFAAALPDIDAISHWSGFDDTFGGWLVLSQSGRDIYSDTHWYSHHGFTHSLLSAMLFAATVWLIMRCQRDKKTFAFVLASLGGYMVHLLGDMITPGGSWGGIRLLYPLDSYFGGWGKVWWWNNYDLFLITVVALLLAFVLAIMWRRYERKGILLTVTLWIAMISTMVLSSNSNFNRGRYADNEIKSKAIQQNRLPASLYKVMEWFDKKLPVLF